MVILAETVCRILNDKDYVHGAISKTSREKRLATKLISERIFIPRKRGAYVHMLRVKMDADGFEKGMHMGLQAHHNVLADPEIPGYTIILKNSLPESWL